MNAEELKALTDPKLLDNFERAIELEVKSSGSGKSPFDKNQLKKEIMDRLDKKTSTSITTHSGREPGDEHDQFS